jgi:nucleoside-triphosphatase THEP1
MKVIATGPPGSGKTTLCRSYVREWQKLGWRVGGLLCPEVRHDEQKIGSDAYDLLSGQRAPMTRLVSYALFKGYTVGKYIINFGGVSFGKQALAKALTEKCDCVVIDEVGPLELQGDGLAESVEACISSAQNLAIVVRSSLVDALLEHFGHGLFQDALIIDATLSTSLYSTRHIPTMKMRSTCFREAELFEGSAATLGLQVDGKPIM